ncbi:hypothetical protein RIF29_15615 [Crotalaria pallida]|uniref:Uncharacterized protein n=1 Tax=Crotalaria pallida TaxID=3830 RepID=A0AAN9ICR6_CROPI
MKVPKPSLFRGKERLEIYGGYREVENRRNKGGCCHGLMARNHQFREEKREKRGQGGNFHFSLAIAKVLRSLLQLSIDESFADECA